MKKFIGLMTIIVLFLVSTTAFATVLFEWDGTYDATTAVTGQTIAGNGLTAGGGEGGTNTTTFDDVADYESVASLTWSSGIASQGSLATLNINQGTILWRGKFDDNSVDSQHIFGFYDSSTGDYIYATYASSGRIYFYIQDHQATPNQVNCYRSFTPVNGQFYNIFFCWDMDVDNSMKISIDGDTYSYTSHSGTESSVILGDLDFSVFYIGNRTSTYSPYSGEISHFEIGDVYQEALSQGSSNNLKKIGNIDLTDIGSIGTISKSSIKKIGDENI